jgi:DNA-binding CsgD family transcriptional regulator
MLSQQVTTANYKAFEKTGGLTESNLASALLHPIGVGVARVDKRFRFKSINPALAVMNNVPLRAHHGKTVHQVLGGVASTLEPLFDQVLTTRRPILGFELSGQLLKRSEPARWVENIYPLLGDKGRIEELEVVVMEITRKATCNPANWRLSPRCEEIVRLVASGHLNKEIADRLGISIKTVEAHRAKIRQKLNLRSGTHLVRYAFQNGLV